MVQNPETAAKSDQELVRMAKDEPDQYRYLMERYQEALFRFVRRITQLPVEDAEDILQEVFVKMYRNLNDYDPEMKFSSWAYRIAHNAAIDYLRKMNVRPRHSSLENEELLKLLPSGEDIADRTAQRDQVERVALALEEMPPKYREALVLRFIEDKSYDEMMDILKKPKGTVATLIDRGRKMLVARMEARLTNQ